MAEQSTKRWDSQPHRGGSNASDYYRNGREMSNNKRGYEKIDGDFSCRSDSSRPFQKRRDTKRGYDVPASQSQRHHDSRRRDEKYRSRNQGNSDSYYGRGGHDDNYYGGQGRGGHDGRYREGGEDSRYGGRNTSTSARDDWRCKECRTWNYPGEDLCRRCGTQNYIEDKDYRGRTRNRARSEDYYQREDRRGSFSHEDDKEMAKKGGGWPPCFESNGSSYAFDARSGFFYHAASDFFFDPKTKLYYSNKKRLYYKYCPDENPPYQEITSTEATASTVDNEAILSQVNKTDGKAAEEKKTIAICLKTKKLGGEKAKKGQQKDKNINKDKGNSSTTPNAANSAVVKKEHAANLEKWAEREKEIRGDNSPSSVPSNSKESSSEKVQRTKQGLPICLICKRKFQTLEKLRKHENLSAMHKENLQKRNMVNAKKKHEESTTPAIEYRDRAKERRFMYGPDTAAIGTKHQSGNRDDSIAGEPNVDRQSEFVRPEENLGESNIGNKMLQKLGWKAGHSLGRKQQQGEDKSTQDGAGGNVSSGQQIDLHETIRKDWQKIESMASAGRQVPRDGGGIGS